MRSIEIDDLDLSLDEMMTLWPQTIPVFIRHKMLCVGCLVGPFHTLVDACVEYDLDQAVLIAELKAAVAV